MRNLYYTIRTTFFIIVSSNLLFGQTPCIDGMSGSYPCQNIDMLSLVSVTELGAVQQGGVYFNDIWGWTDPMTNSEYVILGMANGTSFVDISNPLDPQVIGILPTHGYNSIWRDVKVYQNHAFIVSEAPNHGMQVFDLTQLRNTTNLPATFSETAHYAGINNAHNIVINEATGYAYAVGATEGGQCAQGGLHIINIQDPINPVYEACFDDDGYTHDAQCVIYNGPDTRYQGMEICFNSNENSITIVNVDDKNNMSLVGTSTYEGVAYAHQGWLTEDHRYFLSNDELDELRDQVDNTRTLVWDMIDLEKPQLIGYYDHVTENIDHNFYIAGDTVYQSNYTSGLRVLDTTPVVDGQLREMGYFDLYPENDDVSFDGTWSNYPYFESGTIAVSHIEEGLFLLKVNFTTNYIVKQPQKVYSCIGEDISIDIEVGGQNIVYQWQVDEGDGVMVTIEDSDLYQGSNTSSLQLSDIPKKVKNWNFTCLITSEDGTVIRSEAATITFSSEGIETPVASFDLEIKGNEVVFDNTSTGADRYLWYFGDGSEASTNTSPTYVYDQISADYEVTLMASKSCFTDTIIFPLKTVLSSLGDTTNKIQVYPNPSKGQMTISGLSENYEYKVVTLAGQSLLGGNLSIGDNLIDLQVLGSGLYTLILQNENHEKYTHRISIKY